MKIAFSHVYILSIAAGALVLTSGCVVTPDGRVYFRPVVVAPAPVYVAPPPPPPVYVTPPPPTTVYVAPPPPAPVVEVPDGYVWDGYEYVGLVGDQYYYLGPGNIWFVCEPFRLERFHGWEGGHPDWRVHVVVNERFRNDHYGHFQPRRDDRHDDRRRDDRDHH